jgi:Uma2 family endonuclease
MSVESIPEARLYKAEDLLAMPSGLRYELILGELVAIPPPPGGEHGSKTLALSAYVAVFVDENELGYCFAAETGFKIRTNPDTVMGADFAFVAKERLPGGVPVKHVPLAPDIVMETRSPGDTKREVASKTLVWLQAGTRVVWILDPPAKTLTVHRTDHLPITLGPADTLTVEDILPGFAYSLARLFR